MALPLHTLSSLKLVMLKRQLKSKTPSNLRLNKRKIGEKSISVRPGKRPDTNDANKGERPAFNKDRGG